jgi:hypothetical protein
MGKISEEYFTKEDAIKQKISKFHDVQYQIS